MDRKDVFFYESDDERYIPRTLLIDLEPQVVNKPTHVGPYKDLFNPENLFIAEDGGGAGNNWASGLRQGEEHHEQVLDMISQSSVSLFDDWIHALSVTRCCCCFFC